MTIDPADAGSSLTATANRLLFICVVRALSAAHAIFTEEALHSTLSVNNLLSTSVKWVVPRPNVYVQFWLCRTNGHDNLTVAVNFSVWIPLGMNISFSHCSFCGESISIITFESLGACITSDFRTFDRDAIQNP